MLFEALLKLVLVIDTLECLTFRSESRSVVTFHVVGV